MNSGSQTFESDMTGSGSKRRHRPGSDSAVVAVVQVDVGGSRNIPQLHRTQPLASSPWSNYGDEIESGSASVWHRRATREK